MRIFNYCLLLIAILCFSCYPNQGTQFKSEVSAINTQLPALQKQETTFPINIENVQKPAQVDSIFYSYLSVKSKANRVNFLKNYAPEAIDVILRINRIDQESLHRTDTIVVPSILDKDINFYSPFPEKLKVVDSIDKLVIFSYRIQAFAAYEHGKLVRWGPTSMGKKETPTPTGLQSVNWKEAEHVSSIDPDWNMPYTINLDCNCGVAMHQYALPGKPVSHKCLRLLMADAKWLFYWVDTWVKDKKGRLLAHGTPVLVYGAYDFSQRGPWFKLPKDAAIINISAEELETELSPFLETIAEREKQRKEERQNRRRK